MTLSPSTSEHDAFRTIVRTFCQKELAPYTRAWDAAGTFPRELFKRFAAMGFFGIHYAPELGGSGLDWWYTTAYIEELAHSRNAGVNMSMLVQSEMATPVIDAIGTPEQKHEFLVPALAGDRIAALGISEPDAGSDVASLRTTARRVGDQYVINGAKTYITNGTRADFITLAVRTGDAGHAGISLLLFPTDTPGFEVSKALDKLGNLSSDTGLLYFSNCKIPVRNLLGQENEGFAYIMANFQGERLATAISAVAAAQLMWDDAVAYGKTRQAFDRPIVKFQVWRHKLVDLYARIEAARALTYAAVHAFSRQGAAAVRQISMAKLVATELTQQVAYDCMQLHGGAGYMAEYDISRAFRDVRLLTIGAGSSEIMKEIIAKTLDL